jgi:hypothetical protein
MDGVQAAATARSAGLRGTDASAYAVPNVNSMRAHAGEGYIWTKVVLKAAGVIPRQTPASIWAVWRTQLWQSSPSERHVSGFRSLSKASIGIV